MSKMKECIILAGGFGTRLQSVVKDVPKCMAEVAGKPFLFHIFRYLEQQEVSHVILSLGYKANVVVDWLEDNKFAFPVSYVIEQEPLGTGGAIKFAMEKASSDSVFVINGDTFFSVNLSGFMGFHAEKSADISLCLKPMVDFDRYGSVEIQDDRVVKFNEKKYCKSGLINGGVYLINKPALENLGLPHKFSFEKDVLENLSLDLKILGYKSNSYFIDIGIPEDFAKANIDFLSDLHD